MSNDPQWFIDSLLRDQARKLDEARVCGCLEFTRAVFVQAVVSIGLTDQPDWHDGEYWVIYGARDSRGYWMPLRGCPFCLNPVRDVTA